MPQGEFGKAVARRLGLAALSQSATSDWELGKRSVPAAVVIAAAEVARMDPAELFAAESKRLDTMERLTREIERITGGLTPKQKAKLRVVNGKNR
jgi:transcriptional regulator with XRE-family HTH domain